MYAPHLTALTLAFASALPSSDDEALAWTNAFLAGAHMLEQGRLAEAQAQFESALEVRPENGRAAWYLAATGPVCRRRCSRLPVGQRPGSHHRRAYGLVQVELGPHFAHQLHPLPGDQLVLEELWREVVAFETRSGRARWRRVETPGGGHLLHTSAGWIDASADALDNVDCMQVSVCDRGYSLSELASELLDPKRVRAIADGVEVRAV